MAWAAGGCIACILIVSLLNIFKVARDDDPTRSVVHFHITLPYVSHFRTAGIGNWNMLVLRSASQEAWVSDSTMWLEATSNCELNLLTDGLCDLIVRGWYWKNDVDKCAAQPLWVRKVQLSSDLPADVSWDVQPNRYSSDAALLQSDLMSPNALPPEQFIELLDLFIFRRQTGGPTEPEERWDLAVENAISNRHDAVRIVALEASTWLKDVSLRWRICDHGTTDQSELVRAKVTEALEGLESSRVMRLLKQLGGDSRPLVRSSADHAIQDLNANSSHQR